MDLGNSVLGTFPHKGVSDSKMELNGGHGGGNSGAVISPAPGLGMSAYQDPSVKVKAELPKRQGGS